MLHFKNLREAAADIYLDGCIVSCVGVTPDRGANIGSEGLGYVHDTSTGSGQHHVEHRQFI